MALRMKRSRFWQIEWRVVFQTSALRPQPNVRWREAANPNELRRRRPWPSGVEPAEPTAGIEPLNVLIRFDLVPEQLIGNPRAADPYITELARSLRIDAQLIYAWVPPTNRTARAPPTT